MTSIRKTTKDGKTYTPASYSHIYQLTTVPEKNSKGTWYGWKIDMVSEVTDVAIYNQAKSFAQSINAQGISEETSEETPPF